MNAVIHNALGMRIWDLPASKDQVVEGINKRRQPRDALHEVQTLERLDRSPPFLSSPFQGEERKKKKIGETPIAPQEGASPFLTPPLAGRGQMGISKPFVAATLPHADHRRWEQGNLRTCG